MQNTEPDYQPELLALRSKLAAQIEADTRQVNFFQKRVMKNHTLLQAVKESLSADSSNSGVRSEGYGAKTDTVRAAISRLSSKQFTMTDVERELASVGAISSLPRANLRTALWSLAGKGEIKPIRKGNNQQPALYEKVEAIRRRLKVDSGVINLSEANNVNGRKATA